jgi:hypothetical protein
VARTGRPARTVEQAKEVLEKNVIKTNIGCWEWQKSRFPSGYGAYYWRGDQRAHRSSYRLYHLDGEPIPEGGVIGHTCDNPCCVNPEHLFLGSHADNVADKWQKRRGACGEAVSNHKLTGLDVMSMRERHKNGVSGRALAREYKVAQSTVARILRGESWKHLL